MKFNNFSAVQVRIARPTDKFDEIISFYETGVGLTKIEVFEGDRGLRELSSDCLIQTII